jgi:hypothetical protein
MRFVPALLRSLELYLPTAANSMGGRGGNNETGAWGENVSSDCATQCTTEQQGNEGTAH